MKLKPDLIVAELPAREVCPPGGILAFLDVLFRRTPLDTRNHHAFGGTGQIRDGEADAGNQFPRMPFILGNHPQSGSTIRPDS